MTATYLRPRQALIVAQLTGKIPHGRLGKKLFSFLFEVEKMGMTMTLSRTDLWQRFQRIQPTACGLTLDFSRLDWPASFVEAMAERARIALNAMSALEAGAIANPDEGRQVGHYWLRAAHRAPDPAIGREIEVTQERIRRFAAAVHDGEIRPPKAEKFTRLLVIGIGGSALGPLMVTEALKPYASASPCPISASFL